MHAAHFFRSIPTFSSISHDTTAPTLVVYRNRDRPNSGGQLILGLCAALSAFYAIAVISEDPHAAAILATLMCSGPRAG